MTDRESSKKRPKDDCDRISALPDSILGHILSNLPTKNAVATSILSKRWKFTWSNIHNLDFHCYSCHEERQENEIVKLKFVRFVDRVMLLNDAGFLNKFRLDCTFGHVSLDVLDTNSWINTAITKRVQELYLSVGFSHYGQYQMPISVFSCSSLRSLDLGSIYVTEANVICLPRLECIKLDGTDFSSEEAFENFISGCPVLHYLYLQAEAFHPGFTYIISSTSLRRLEIHFEECCGLNLNASSLEYLNVSGWLSEIFVQDNLVSLDEVKFTICSEECYADSIVEAVQAFDCAKTITFSGDVLKVLGSSTICLLPEFTRLVELEIGYDYGGYISLQDFIQYTDNLQVLTLDQCENDEAQKWDSPVEVARCLSNSLKKVIVNGYHGYEEEREAIRYMLKHGNALEIMQISCFPVNGSKMLMLVKEICEFPRKSPVCEVKFL